MPTAPSRVFFGSWVTLAFSVMVFVGRTAFRHRGPRSPDGPGLGPGSDGSLMDVTGGYGGACAVGCAILALAVVTVPVDEQPRSQPVLGPVAGGR